MALPCDNQCWNTKSRARVPAWLQIATQNHECKNISSCAMVYFKWNAKDFPSQRGDKLSVSRTTNLFIQRVTLICRQGQHEEKRETCFGDVSRGQREGTLRSSSGLMQASVTSETGSLKFILTQIKKKVFCVSF